MNWRNRSITDKQKKMINTSAFQLRHEREYHQLYTLLSKANFNGWTAGEASDLIGALKEYDAKKAMTLLRSKT